MGEQGGSLGPLGADGCPPLPPLAAKTPTELLSTAAFPGATLALEHRPPAATAVGSWCPPLTVPAPTPAPAHASLRRAALSLHDGTPSAARAACSPRESSVPCSGQQSGGPADKVGVWKMTFVSDYARTQE